jgi:1-phosphofructokinase family hexose kinase
VRQQAGGKGFNVARALRTFGAAVAVVAPLGGHIGALVRDLAGAEGISCDSYTIAGETRTCLTVVDAVDRQISEVYEVGPTIDADTWRQFVDHVRVAIDAATLLAIAGSVMPGAPTSGLHDLVVLAGARRIPAMLDTYGAALSAALPARPALVKINHIEATDLLGQAITSFDDLIAAARMIQQRGADAVVITLGQEGAGGVDQAGRPFGWAAPAVESVSPIGSGDVFFGALLAAIGRGVSLAEAARWGVAAGAANTLEIGAGIFSRTQAEQLVQQATPVAGL